MMETVVEIIKGFFSMFGDSANQNEKELYRRLADLYEEEERKELRKLIDDTEVLNKLLEIHKQAFLKRCGVEE